MNTTEPRLLRVEAVADLPVLWATFQRLDLPATLDRHFPAPLHWKGPLTPGEVLAVWLLFLVSQGDHCLNHVQPWVAQHQGTLSALLGKAVLPVHAHDDRLADWLTRLGAGDRLQRPGARPEPADHPRLPAPHRPRPHRHHHRQLLRRGPVRAGALAVRPQQGRPRPAPAQDRRGRPRPAGPAAGHGRRARQHGRRSVVRPGHPGGATVPRGGRPDLRGRLQDGRPGHPRLRGGRAATSTCARCRRPSSAGPSGASCCGRSSTARRRCSRCGDPAPKGSPTNWWRRGSAVDVELTATVGEQEVRWTERRWLVRSQAYAQAQEAALERRLATATAALRELVVRKQGKKQLFHAELMQAAEAIVDARRRGGLAELHGASADDDTARCVPTGAVRRGRRRRCCSRSRCNATRR